MMISIAGLQKGEPMLTIDKTKVDAIIDGLLGNNDLTASPEVWYGLHQIKNLPVTEIVRCGECVNFSERDFCKVAGHNVHRKSNCMKVFGAERRTDD